MNKMDILKKAEKVASASLWEKNGMVRIYVTYEGKNFYLDLVNMTAQYKPGIKGNICTVRDFLDAAEIDFTPLTSTYDSEIKLVEKATDENIVSEYIEKSNEAWKQYRNNEITEDEHEKISNKLDDDLFGKMLDHVISDESYDKASLQVSQFINNYRTHEEQAFDKLMGY